MKSYFRKMIIQAKADLELAAARTLPTPPENPMHGQTSAQSSVSFYRSKVESDLSLKQGALATVETELEQEADPAAYGEVEQFLKAHPGRLLRCVAEAYRDGKVTS